jgi:hypothetical protein
MHSKRKAKTGCVYNYRDLFVRAHPPVRSVCYIPVAPNGYTIVDRDDYDRLIQFNWYFAHSGHVVCKPEDRMIFMHRVVMDTPLGFETDHVNRCPWDNRKENLRICTRAQNKRNQVFDKSRTSSRYKGVKFVRRDFELRKPWAASIMCDYRIKNLGYFATEEDAARAYDEAARRLHGPFAYLNFPLDQGSP